MYVKAVKRLKQWRTPNMKGWWVIGGVVIVAAIWLGTRGTQQATPPAPAPDAKQQEEERRIEELAAQKRRELAEGTRLKQEEAARKERERKEKELRDKEDALRQKEAALLKAREDLLKKQEEAIALKAKQAATPAPAPRQTLVEVEVDCPSCKGKKLLVCVACDGKGKSMARVQCPNCRGVIKDCAECPTELPSVAEYPWGRNYARQPGTQFCFNCRGTGGHGAQKVAPFTLPTSCARCGGKGFFDCPKCKGGTVVCWRCENRLTVMKEENCTTCRGKGKVNCPRCDGEGKVVVSQPRDG